MWRKHPGCRLGRRYFAGPARRHTRKSIQVLGRVQVRFWTQLSLCSCASDVVGQSGADIAARLRESYGATLMVALLDAVFPTFTTSGTAPETPVGTVTAIWYSPTKLGEAIE